jgi:N-acetylmuramic acid 6-phosphate etherase
MADDAVRNELDGLTTEASGSRADLDLRPTVELVLAMNDEDIRVPAAVRAAAPAIARAVDGISERMSRGGRLVYIGAGTSGRLGVLDASECPPTFGIDPARVVGIIAGGDRALRVAAESVEDDAAQGAADVAALGLTADDALVGIAASGRTPYVAGALERARGLGAFTVAVACNAGSRIGELAEVAIEVVVGPEFITGSTRLKSGTAQKLVLNTLSTLTMVRLGKTHGDVMIDMRATNEKLFARAQRMVIGVTGCTAGEAAAALAEAQGSAKTAALMLLADLTATQAEARLAAAGGRLRVALSADE